MELVVRLHRMNIENKWGAKIRYALTSADYVTPRCHEEIGILRNQRVRWHRGLFESLWTHRKMALNPKYGGIGLVAIPYFLIVELFGPVIEMTGYIMVFLGWILGEVNIQYPLALLLFMVMYGSFLSMGSVLLEEWRLGKHKRVSELNRLFFFALSEAFWYRPVLTYWRVKALFSAIRGEKTGLGRNETQGHFGLVLFAQPQVLSMALILR